MKLPRNSFVSRLIVAFLSVSLVTVLLVSIISYSRARDVLVSAVFDRLEATLQLKEDALNRWVDEKLDDVTFVKTQPDFKKGAEAVLCGCDPENYPSAYNNVFGTFQIMFVNMEDFAEVSLLSARGGEVVVSSRLENEGDFRVSDTYFIEGMKGPYVQEIYLSPLTFKPTITVATPVRDDEGQSVGVLAAHLDVERMDRIILERSGLGDTGEAYLVDSSNAFVSGESFGRADFPRGAHSEGIDNALAGRSGTGLYKNYAGIPVIGAFKWDGGRQLAILAEIHQREAFAPARTLAIYIGIVGCLISLLLAAVVNLIARRIASPILSVQRAAEGIAGGDRSVRAPIIKEDEVGNLARSFNLMVDEIQESESRLQTVFNMSPGVIVLSRIRDKVIVDVNEEFTRVTGFSREETVGQNVMDLGLWDDFGKREEFTKKVVAEGSAANFEFKFQVKDREIKVGLLSGAVVMLSGEPHILFGAQDITEIKDAERALQESEEKFRTIFMTSPDSVSLSSLEDGAFVDVNDGFVRLTGYSREEALGMSAMELWVDKSLRREIVESLASKGEIHNLEGRFRVKDGNIRTGLISASVIELGDKRYVLGVHKDITEQKRTENALRESEANYRLLADNVSDVIWVWDRNLKPIYYSPSIFHLRGVTPEEALVQPLEEVLTPGSLEIVLKMLDLELEREMAGKGLQPEDPLILELELLRKNGTSVWVEVSTSVLRDTKGEVSGIIGVSRDITRRRLAEQALKESEERYRILFNSGSDAVFISGIAKDGLPGKFYAINDQACRLLGRTRQELMELRPLDITAPNTPITDADAVTRIQEEEQTVFERLLLHANGKQIPVEITGNRFHIFDSPALYFIVRDLTDRKRIEEENKKIQTKLIQANKMTSLGLMVSSLAHEINNPNNTIMFNLRRFARTWDDTLPILRQYQEEHGDFNVGGVPFSELSAIFPRLISGTLESSEMIKAIIENLKGFVRQSTDNLDFNVDINDVIQSSVSLLESQVRKGMGRLETDLSDDLPKIKGNPQKLVQVLVNLISNALEAITGDDQRIQVTSLFDPSSREIRVTVADEGAGMTREQLDSAAEPFYSTKLESGGTGLGLTITKMLLGEHGAELHMESAPDLGTIATIILSVEDA